MQRSNGVLISLALVIATSFGASFVVMAQEPDQDAQAEPHSPGAATNRAPAPAGWTVLCGDAGKDLACKAEQTIVLRKTRQLLLRVTVNRPEKDKSAAMLIQLPHGLFNPAGVLLGVDEAEAEKLEIQTCDAKGCYAGHPITSERLAAMTKGKTLKVTFQDLKKQKIVVPVPLKGFAAAYNKL